MNWWGIVVSFAYVFAFIGIAQVLLKAGHISPSVTRKVIHIGVAHWWVLAMLFFTRWQFAIVGPISFVFINLASFLFRLFPAMERERRSRSLGTVYFPISLTAIVLLTWGGPIPIWVGGISILVLGWGDGLASVVGEGRRGGLIRVFGNAKSIAGSLTMWAASAVVVAICVLIFTGPSHPGAFSNSLLDLAQAIGRPGAIIVAAASTGLVAAVVELVTPLGLDNLSVPLVTLFFFYLV